MLFQYLSLGLTLHSPFLLVLDWNITKTPDYLDYLVYKCIVLTRLLQLPLLLNRTQCSGLALLVLMI